METDIPKQYREDFFRAVVETVTDPVALVSKDFKILYHNKMVSEMYGSIVGEVCFETLFCLKQPCENCLMLDVLKDGKPRKKIAKFELPNGRIVWGESNAAPFKNAEGEIIGIIDILRDITEQKEAKDLLQEVLARLNAELLHQQLQGQYERIGSLFLQPLWEETLLGTIGWMRIILPYTQQM